jgi:hypothetical protein
VYLDFVFCYVWLVDWSSTLYQSRVLSITISSLTSFMRNAADHLLQNM